MGVEGELILLKQKQEILLMYLREGRSQREISRMTGVDRKTIRKYIKEYERKREELERNNVVEDPAELIQAIVETPKYKVGDRPKRKLTDDIIQKIQEHIYENEEKRRKGLRKQLKKPIDIYEALTIEGIDISYSTVLRMIRSMKKKPRKRLLKDNIGQVIFVNLIGGKRNLSSGANLESFRLQFLLQPMEISGSPIFLRNRPQNVSRKPMHVSSKRLAAFTTLWFMTI